jgi:hypothetical protein
MGGPIIGLFGCTIGGEKDQYLTTLWRHGNIQLIKIRFATPRDII